MASKSRKSRKNSSPVSPTVVEPRLLGVAAAAAYLGCTLWYTRSLVWNRAVPYLRLGKRILFDKSDLDSYIDQQKQQANPPLVSVKAVSRV